ncbi:ras-induced vulval development antagonist-domain-containing protein [Pisolithus marmoratus]|nr:ras-induced vulval development antagonist-domain-containing protein [Pisolithus marmoratus]
MATVHPSRMGLVPQDPRDNYQTERRDPRSRSSSPGSGGFTTGRSRQRSRSGGRPRSISRHRDGGDEERGVSRDRRRDRGRESDDKDHRERRRPSPEYSDYNRPPSPSQAAPWRQQENMYPPRTYRDRPPHGHGTQSTDYLESRRLQREASTVSIWPPSPKGPARQLSPVGSSRRKSKRDRPETSSDLDTDSESEYERRKRERKDRKRRKHREHREKTGKKGRRRERGRSQSYEGSGDDVDRRLRKSRSKSKSQQPRSPSPSRTPSSPVGSEEEEWVEKPVAASIVAPSQLRNDMPPPSTIPMRKNKAPTSSFVNLNASTNDDSDDSDEEVGPQPLIKTNTKKVDERAYGGALLRGEGSAMAAFLQESTDSRIPRRGEIGLTSDEIASFEAVGYVMSGSRHKRMNAVRMRKENQVISTEEKRGILKLQKEERARREAILREEFGELVQEKLKTPEGKPRQ